jgi:DNA-binding MarR family transcriptional regulator
MGNSKPQLDPEKCAEIARTCACFNFRKASRSVTQLYDQILAPGGLRSTQLVILLASYLLGSVSMARMARELVMDRSTLTRNLQPLVSQKLLTISSAKGRNSKSVELTEAGTEALCNSIQYWERAQGHLVGKLGAERLNQIMEDLGTIVEATRSGTANS